MLALGVRYACVKDRHVEFPPEIECEVVSSDILIRIMIFGYGGCALQLQSGYHILSEWLYTLVSKRRKGRKVLGSKEGRKEGK